MDINALDRVCASLLLARYDISVQPHAPDFVTKYLDHACPFVEYTESDLAWVRYFNIEVRPFTSTERWLSLVQTTSWYSISSMLEKQRKDTSRGTVVVSPSTYEWLKSLAGREVPT